MRHFFNVAGAVHDPDNQGQDIASLSDARIHAVKSAADYLRDRPDLVWLGEAFRVEKSPTRIAKRCSPSSRSG